MVATLVHSQSSPVFSRDHVALPDMLSRSFTTGSAAENDSNDGTQPIDTQAFKGYSDVFTSNLGLSRVNSNMTQEKPGTQNGGALRVVSEPDFELTDDMQVDDDIVSLSGEGDTPGSPNTQFLKPLAPSQGARYPETPSIAGSKRKRRLGGAAGVQPTSELATPQTARTDLAGMFAVAQPADGLSLTQIFENTQAPSSPPPMRSDPVFQRPSPGLMARQSSPLPDTQSSPVKHVGLGSLISPLPPKNTQMFTTQQRKGPLGAYRSMKESQERRARLLAQQQQDTQGTDGSGSSTSTQMERHLARQRREKEIANELRQGADLTAPPRSSPEGRRRPSKDPPSTIDLVTPQTVKPRKGLRRHKSTSIDFDGFDGLDAISDVDEEIVTSAVQILMTSSKPMDATQPEIASSPCQRHDAEKSGSSEGDPDADQAGDNPAIISATQKTELIMDSQMEAVIESLLPPMTELSSLDPNLQRPSPQMLKKFREMVGAGIRPTGVSSSIPHPPISPLSSQRAAITSSPPAEPIAGSVEYNPTEGTTEDNDVDVVVAPVSPPESRTQQSPRFNVEAPSSQSEGQVQNDDDPQPASPAKPQNTEDASNNVTTYVTADTHQTSAVESGDTSDRLFCTQLPAQPAALQTGSSGDDLVFSQPVCDMNIDSIDILDEGDRDFYRLMAHSPLKSRNGYSSGSSPVRPAKRRKPETSAPTRFLAPVLGQVKAIANTTQGSKHNTRVQETEPAFDVPMSTDPLSKSFDKPRGPSRESGSASTAAPKHVVGKLKAPKVKAKADKSGPGKRRSNTFEPESSTKTTETSHVALSVEPQADTVVEPIEETTPIATVDSTETVIEPETVLYPTRILARWRGQSKQAYYPATCLGPSRSGQNVYQVRFDEGTTTQLHVDQIASLQLCKGDIVKVDLSDMRNSSYVVEALTNIIDSQLGVPSNEDENVLVDVYGHQTVILRVKQTGSNQPVADSEKIHVHIGSIYVPNHLRSKLIRNDQLYLQPESVVQSRFLTPVTLQSEATTPTNRVRRQAQAHAEIVSFTSKLASPQKQSGKGLFANMAFAITLASDLEPQKIECIKLLQDNGATLIQLGFEELFDLPQEADDARSTAHTASESASDHQAGLRLKTAAFQLKFVALLADKHSRRAKHMQALALNLPILHYRWLADSVEAGKVLPVMKYTLPAGESEFLGGAIRSRMMAFIDPLSPAAQLEATLQGREQLIAGKNVILVTGKGKIGASRRTFEFLSYAMGARHVSCVATIDEAKGLLGSDQWDWIHVDGNEKQAERSILGNAKIHSRKRKRKSGKVEVEVPSSGDGVPRIVSDEYVIQSLILGALL